MSKPSWILPARSTLTSGNTIMFSKRASIVALIIMLVVSEGACVNTAGDCKNEIVKEVLSPIGDMKAVVFQRACGAPKGVTTQVSVLSAHQQLPNERGNIFIGDSDRGKAPSYAGGGPIVEVSWSNGNELAIRYDKRALLLQTSPSLGNIQVRYEAFAP